MQISECERTTGTLSAGSVFDGLARILPATGPRGSGLFNLLHSIVQSVDDKWMPDSAVTSITNIIKKKNSTQNSLPDSSMNFNDVRMQELSKCIKLRFSFSVNIPYFLVYVHRAEHCCQIVSCLILHAGDKWLHFRTQGCYFDWGFSELFLDYLRRKPKIISYACIRHFHSTFL